MLISEVFHNTVIFEKFNDKLSRFAYNCSENEDSKRTYFIMCYLYYFLISFTLSSYAQRKNASRA